MKKRLWAVAMAFCLSLTGAVPVMAETEAKPRVFVSFVSAGQSVGKFISQGTSTTAPEAVFMPGYTFCGWDKPLNNIQFNTQFNAVYLPDYVGEAAIEARKKSLPSPAISKTKVADPVDLNTDNAVCLPQQAAAFTAQAMAQAAGLMTSAAAQAQAAQTLQQAAVQASAAASQYAQAQAALSNIM
ncbi:MAG: hypothetical protein J6O55_07215, partial [Lachnospiraceae bacterium]|nr:hypothetical protein [Lachnospiraceae bacterium]